MPSSFLQRTRLLSSVEEFRNKLALLQAVLAEFVGTFLLVFVGVASCLAHKRHESDTTPIASAERISFAFGLSVAVLVWNLAHVSGGHINPAVTLGMLVCRRVSLLRAGLYMLAQVVAAILASLVVKDWVERSNSSLVVAPNQHHPEFTDTCALLVEAFITFMLVFTVFAACDKMRSGFEGFGPLMIGLSVGACHMAFATISGAGMNPARSFGPAVVYGDMSQVWIYWVGPMVGGMFGAIVYDLLFAGNASFTRSRAWLLAEKFNPDQALASSEAQKHAGNVQEKEEQCAMLKKSADHPAGV